MGANFFFEPNMDHPTTGHLKKKRLENGTTKILELDWRFYKKSDYLEFGWGGQG